MAQSGLSSRFGDSSRGLSAHLSRLLLLVVTSMLTNGCTDIHYAWQATRGHLQLLNEAKPIDEVLANPDVDQRLSRQLLSAKSIRSFSVQVMGLPDNKSYTQFADLKRPFVVWNVFAAPELSLKLYQWCFPVTGCLSYKGFFDQEAARQEAELVKAQGYDVSVAGIQAYSTLGWTADPLLNTFIYYPAGELARMVFHELAHQVVYIKDDTAFNESFATAVEELGVDRWLVAQDSPALDTEYRQFDARKKVFKQLLLDTQEKLQALYASDLSDDEKRSAKAIIVEATLTQYRMHRDKQWGGWKGYDRFFAEGLNNAKLAGVGLYQIHVPAFKALFQQSGSDFPAFYEAVRQLGKLSRSERDKQLQTLQAGFEAGQSKQAGLPVDE